MKRLKRRGRGVVGGEDGDSAAEVEVIPAKMQKKKHQSPGGSKRHSG